MSRRLPGGNLNRNSRCPKAAATNGGGFDEIWSLAYELVRDRFGLVRGGPRLAGGPAQLTGAGRDVVADGVAVQHLGRA